ncbi:E3 ubiquitin-protein ligase pub1 [Umbelopsis sp. WA50703]
MNGQNIMGKWLGSPYALQNKTIRVHWATQGQVHKEDTSQHHHIFVGDLSSEVTDTTLSEAFSSFSSMSDARVMWDQNSGKSRGFGFVSFEDRAEADKAINTMNGLVLGSKAIRCNWANQKNSRRDTTVNHALSYEQILRQTHIAHTTIYVGNLPHYIKEHELAPFFQQFGYVLDIRLQGERGFAFVKLDTHINAAIAIVSLQGVNIAGRPARLSWGKDRATNNYTFSNPTPAPPAPYLTQMAAPSPVWVESNGQQPQLQPWMGVYYPAYQPTFNTITGPLEEAK